MAVPQMFDAVKYKETTRRQWENAARAWHRWTPMIETWLGPATEEMLDMVELRPGSWVLDLAAGAGGQAVFGEDQLGLVRHVLGYCAQALADIDRIGRGDELAAVGGAVEVAQELAVQRFEAAFVLQPGKLSAAAIVGERCRRHARTRVRARRAHARGRRPPSPDAASMTCAASRSRT